MALSPHTPVGYLVLPLQMYLRGDFEQRQVILSPLFPLAVLVVVLPRARCHANVYALALTAGFFVGWLTGFEELRYLLPICGPLSLVTAVVLRAGWSRRGWRAAIQGGLLVSAAATLLLTTIHVNADHPAAVLLGHESPDAYLRASASYRATQYLVATMQPGERAVLFNDAQVFYLPPDAAVVTDHLNLNLLRLTEAHPAPADALAALQTERVNYLLVYEANVRFWSRFDPSGRVARGQAVLDQLTPLLQEIYRDGPANQPDVIIYRVPPGPSGATP